MCYATKWECIHTKLSLEIWVNEIGIKSFGSGYKLADLSDESITYAIGGSIPFRIEYQ